MIVLSHFDYAVCFFFHHSKISQTFHYWTEINARSYSQSYLQSTVHGGNKKKTTVADPGGGATGARPL